MTRTFQFRYEPVEDLKAKVREIEAKLGIPASEGVSIVYSRKAASNVETLAPLIIIGILVALGYAIWRKTSFGISSITK